MPEGAKQKTEVGGLDKSTVQLIEDKIAWQKNVPEIDDRTFDSRVLQSDKPVLVDFWTPWCDPCKTVGPVVEKLAEAYGGQFRFARCNVDKNPKISNE